MRLGLLALCALGLGCGEEDETLQGSTTSGRENGESCIFTNAGANGCKGKLCVGVLGSALGVCSEPCTDTCNFGGRCGVLPEVPDRVCLKDCETDVECRENYGCLPSAAIKVCEGTSCEANLDVTWCVPLP